MPKISNELKIAITVVVSIIIAILGFRIMRDNPLFRQAHLVHTHFERVDGLNAGNYVYVNGVKVGSVKQIRLIGPDSVRVSLGIDLGIRLPKGSKAYLTSSGLLEDKAIIVERSDNDEEVPYGGTIEGEYRGGLMETLKSEGEQLSNNISSSFDKLNGLLNRLNKVMTEENRGNISETLSNIRTTSTEISELIQKKRDKLESSIDHANTVLANIDTLTTTNRDKVDSLLVRMDRSFSELEGLARNMSRTSEELNSVLQKINEGEGSLGKLVNSPSLYNHMDSLAVEMKTLVENINENPRKYLKHMRLIEVF